MPGGNEIPGLWAVAALVAYAMYRRLRRNFGRQQLRPARLGLRIAVLGAVGLAMMPVALRSAAFLWTSLAGIGLGLCLAVWAARRMRFERLAGRLYFIPHAYTGIAVSALFLGRILYRFAGMAAGGSAAGGLNSNSYASMSPGAMVQSPLTVGLLWVLIAYYVYYYAALLWKSRHLARADFEPATEVALRSPK